MSDNLQKPCISLFSQSESRTHPCHVSIQYGRLFGSNVLLNKRRLTGNRPGSARRETGRKKSLPQHQYQLQTFQNQLLDLTLNINFCVIFGSKFEFHII